MRSHTETERIVVLLYAARVVAVFDDRRQPRRRARRVGRLRMDLQARVMIHHAESCGVTTNARRAHRRLRADLSAARVVGVFAACCVVYDGTRRPQPTSRSLGATSQPRLSGFWF